MMADDSERTVKPQSPDTEEEPLYTESDRESNGGYTLELENMHTKGNKSGSVSSQLQLFFSGRRTRQRWQPPLTIKRFKCNICGMKFAISRVLEAHKMIEHGMEAAWKCRECGMQFLHGKSYNLHMISRHFVENPHTCDTCSEVFPSKTDLKMHKRSHSTGREKQTYKCPDCPAEYPHASKLRYHRRVHTGERPFGCNICNAAFATSSQRLNHLNRSHFGIRKHLCDHCGKKFTGPRELREHYRTHTGERPYECSVCFRAFTKSNALVVHLRQHTGEKPYVCDQCGQAFTVKVSLRTHLKNKHNIIDNSGIVILSKPNEASQYNYKTKNLKGSRTSGSKQTVGNDSEYLESIPQFPNQESYADHKLKRMQSPFSESSSDASQMHEHLSNPAELFSDTGSMHSSQGDLSGNSRPELYHLGSSALVPTRNGNSHANPGDEERGNLCNAVPLMYLPGTLPQEQMVYGILPTKF